MNDMNIIDYLPEKQVFLDVKVKNKEGVLRFIAEASVKNGIVKNGDLLFTGMKKREETMSTGVGMGIGIPHTTSKEANDAALLLIRLSNPIDFQSLDGQPIDIAIALVIPENNTTLHLRLLARVTRLCRNKEFLKALRRAVDPSELCSKIRKLEEKIINYN